MLTHEVGHSIGLGHTQDDGTVVDPQADIMFASCCSVATPTPPSLGPDDLDSLTYLYPTGGACTYAVGPSSARRLRRRQLGLLQAHDLRSVRLERATEQLQLRDDHVAGRAACGPGIVFYNVAPNPGGARSGTLTIAGQTVTVTQGGNLPSMALDKSSLTFGGGRQRRRLQRDRRRRRSCG